MNTKVLVVGCGSVAIEHAKVLSQLRVSFDVVGRGPASAKKFSDQVGVQPHIGGLREFVGTQDIAGYSHVLVATNTVSLADNVNELILAGAKRILVEKPGVLWASQLDLILRNMDAHSAKVFIGYNRRFYSSVNRAGELVAQDGGLEMVRFEFTEWSHVIDNLEKDPVEKERWLLANSSHVIDLAFYFSGLPQSFKPIIVGQLDWHPAGAIFCGAGTSVAGVPFSYAAHWGSAGRWGLELFTKKRKLVLCPIESLKQVVKGSVREEDVELKETTPMLKPGFYGQMTSFLGDGSRLLSVEQFAQVYPTYCKIGNYEP